MRQTVSSVHMHSSKLYYQEGKTHFSCEGGDEGVERESGKIAQLRPRWEGRFCLGAYGLNIALTLLLPLPAGAKNS